MTSIALVFTVKVRLSGILLSNSFTLMACFFVESIVLYTFTFATVCLQEEEVNAVSAPRTPGRQ
jgi:hypothetical protein